MKLFKNFLLIFTLFLSNQAICQLSQSDAQAFINAHPPKSVARVWVNKKVDWNSVDKDFRKEFFSFDAATTVITAKSSSLHIKDGTGTESYIPYISIKSLDYQPETDKLYSSIIVFIQ
jgi:hypothetical protein